MSMNAPATWLKVNAVSYRMHKKPGKPDSVRVEYRCGLAVYSEWVLFDHKGYPREKALKWWRRRMTGPGILPASTADALARADTLMKPTEIQVRKNGKYTEVVEFRFMPNVQAGGSGVPVSAAAGGASSQSASLFNAVHG